MSTFEKGTETLTADRYEVIGQSVVGPDKMTHAPIVEKVTPDLTVWLWVADFADETLADLAYSMLDVYGSPVRHTPTRLGMATIGTESLTTEAVFSGWVKMNMCINAEYKAGCEGVRCFII
jgi:hypothetical protein